jgi:hypothetical protein
MIALFLITKQFIRPAGRPTADFPDPKDQPMFNIQEIADPTVKDNLLFAEPLSLPCPTDYPPGNHEGRVARIAVTGYRHGEFKTSFKTQVIAWGGKVDMSAAIAAMMPAGDASLFGAPSTQPSGVPVNATLKSR